ncbi:MAG: bifunctional phosphoribosylaminoimidazolecarboxamide formyltransferase/IMP cyclohydrolase [bacterium]
MPKIKRALLSVYDKTGIVEFTKVLDQFGVEMISTGGTARHLNKNGIKTRSISGITEFPEILQGRVKTLHPKILGGLLALREDSAQMGETRQHGIDLIDLVVVNLYPFEETISKKDVSLSDALENIDIGGPTMIRAAAKNYLDVTVVTEPNQYDKVLTELKNNQGEVTLELRQQLAVEAFALTCRYDAVIHDYLSKLLIPDRDFPHRIYFTFDKVQDLRYGENPHQRAALYHETGKNLAGLTNAKQLHGKELSFNNIMDLGAAIGIVAEFEEPCAVIIKHTNPCGAAIGQNLCEAYLNAKATDPVSAFGGIVGLNRTVDQETAQAVSEIFTEAIVAPGFEAEALATLKSKKNLRVLDCSNVTMRKSSGIDIKWVDGGLLVQDQDLLNMNDINLRVVTKRQPSEEEWAAMKFAWRVAKWVKSNAVVYTKKDRTIGIGAGQMSRVDSSLFAAEKARRMGLSLAGTAVASDAFFPFRDGVDAAAEAGATAIIQPGGSIRDEEVIRAADEHNLTMVFTHVRHFRH